MIYFYTSYSSYYFSICYSLSYFHMSYSLSCLFIPYRLSYFCTLYNIPIFIILIACPIFWQSWNSSYLKTLLFANFYIFQVTFSGLSYFHSWYRMSCFHILYSLSYICTWFNCSAVLCFSLCSEIGPVLKLYHRMSHFRYFQHHFLVYSFF